MAEILKLSCDTTVECIAERTTRGGRKIIVLSVSDPERRGSIPYVDVEEDIDCAAEVQISVAAGNLRPLIQWLTLLELELRDGNR